MSTSSIQRFPETAEWKLPSRGKVGMACLILAETAMFAIFVVAYVYYIGRDASGPKPHDVLEMPIFGTVCLFSSSLFIWLAEHAIERGRMRTFRTYWAVTILLGALFLVDTGVEWHKLISHDHLTISTNLFGTTFYALVGLHATHVVVGLFLLSVALIASLRGALNSGHSERVKVLAMYWHFVDAVWAVVFTVVYVVSAR